MLFKNSKKQPSISFDSFLRKNPSNEQLERWDKFQTIETAIQNRDLAKILFYTAIVTFIIGFIALVKLLFFDLPTQTVTVCLTVFEVIVALGGYKSLMVHYFPSNPKNVLPNSSNLKLPLE